ncbi:hypothetical protein NMY22_g4676 [Coprinellus aureogranulatus]|nr:hypothetical protein NMY22_g4676 [Coprinellus aureogranulatus]
MGDVDTFQRQASQNLVDRLEKLSGFKEAKQLEDLYRELLDEFSEVLITKRARDFGAHANHLTRLASVSAFLSNVQIGFIAFTAGAPLGEGERTGPIWVSMNFFSFLSLFLDTFSAFFCLLFADELSKRLNACNSLRESKSYIDFNIARFATLTENGKQTEATKLFNNDIKASADSFVTDIRQIRRGRLLDHPNKEEHVVKGAILLSMLSFSLAFTLYIRETQAPLVWKTTLPVAASIAFLLIVNWWRSRF